MKRVLTCIAIFACLSASASAQLPFQPPAAQEKKPDVQKPVAPTKPIVPNAGIAPKAALPSAAAPFASELQALSPAARTFATAKLAAITPSLRVSAATRATGKAVGLSDIPETWLASAGAPSGSHLWLGARSADLLTGPDMEPSFRVAGGPGPGGHETGVWVQFVVEVGIRYLLICDMTDPARWDVVPADRSRMPMAAETDTRGVALISARSATGRLRILLTLARPQQTAPGSSLTEVLRRCEVTPIRG